MQSEFDDAHDAPPAPPRAINPVALRRSWNEAPVRLWLILTVIITLSTLWFVYRDVGAAITERRLIFHGKTVSARIDMLDQYDRKERTFERDEPHEIYVRYTTPEGRLILIKSLAMPPSGHGVVRVGDMVDIRVDPDDPYIATMQTQPRSWGAALAVVSLLAPLSILLAIITLAQRHRVLKIWRGGEAARAVVVDSHRSGIAPKSKIVRFNLDASDDLRVFTTLFPRDAGEFEPGDAFWIIMPPGAPARAIVAELYQPRSIV